MGKIRLIQLDAAHGSYAVTIGHTNFHKNDIHLVLHSVLHSRLYGCRLGDDLDLGVCPACSSGHLRITSSLSTINSRILFCLAMANSSRERNVEGVAETAPRDCQVMLPATIIPEFLVGRSDWRDVGEDLALLRIVPSK